MMDFNINLILGTTLIYKAFYIMAQPELEILKKESEEYTTNGFIRSSTSK